MVVVTLIPGSFYRIDLWHGCHLLLTAQEYRQGLKRAKSDRRREANDKLAHGDGNILDAITDKEEER